MSQKTVKILAISGVIVIMFFLLLGSVISFFNQEAKLRNMYEQKLNSRTAFYDKMWKTLSQKS